MGVLNNLGPDQRGGRGRPSDRLAIADRAGIVLGIDMGATHTRLAAATLNQQVLEWASLKLDVTDGPDSVVKTIISALDDMVSAVAGAGPVRFAVMGVPARVDMTAGTPMRPNIMPGWDRHPVAAMIGKAFDCPTLLENDTNLRALGEAAALGPDELPLVAIKVATGVGGGIVHSDGHLFHGYLGAAGDIGHVTSAYARGIVCTCGLTGCLEAVASLPSVVRRSLEGQPDRVRIEDDAATLLELLRSPTPQTMSAIRTAAEALGEAVAMLCNTINPRRVVLSGELPAASDELIATIRAVAYRLARPLASRNVIITDSVLGETSGLAGAVVLAIREALSASSLAQGTAA